MSGDASLSGIWYYSQSAVVAKSIELENVIPKSTRIKSYG